MARDLSDWQGRIYPFRENDKRWSNKKSGSENEHLEILGRNDWKSTLRTPPKEGKLGTSWRETSKWEHSEKIRKGLATNIADITLVLVPKATNGGN